MYFKHRFNEKPVGKLCGWVQKSLEETEISIEDLATALTNGASFKPAVLRNGRKAENWHCQQLFGLDFDDGTTIEQAYEKVCNLGILPIFIYTTFSHKDDHHKFRMIFCADTVIYDGDIRDKLQATLMGIIGGIDEVCFNRDRLFFGGKGRKTLHTNFDNRINADDVISRYWCADYEKYISGTKKAVKKATSTKKAVKKVKSKKELQVDSVTDFIADTNVDAISTLNVKLMRKRLGFDGSESVDFTGVKSDEGVLGDTNRKESSLSVSQKTPSDDESGLNTDNIHNFKSEQDMYDYINSIDLCEYLGLDDIGDSMFPCLLPTHEDNDPSAHIYTTDSGTQIYKCFGCGQARTIISFTEQLARCKRRQAINFIKEVYGIEYEVTPWVEQQRQMMIDSALYLNSEEFIKTFPQINKLIRTRKADIQMILMHMTKLINEDMQYEGKPLFFASMPSLMQICNRNNKNIMSQSITLFALLM